MLRMRAVVVRELNGTVYRFFQHQACWSLLKSCYTDFSHKADVEISRLSFNAQTAWTVLN